MDPVLEPDLGFPFGNRLRTNKIDIFFFRHFGVFHFILKYTWLHLIWACRISHLKGFNFLLKNGAFPSRTREKEVRASTWISGRKYSVAICQAEPYWSPHYTANSLLPPSLTLFKRMTTLHALLLFDDFMLS